MSVRLTLKNFRCFSDQSPVTIDISDGFTALIGQNNSGKSSLLRFIYECRGIFSMLTAGGSMLAAIEGSKFGAPPQNVSDSLEIYCNQNERPLSVTVEVRTEPGSQSQLAKAEFTSSKSDPGNWTASYWTSDHRKLEATRGTLRFAEPTTVARDDGNPLVDFAVMNSAATKLLGSMYMPAFRNILTQSGDRPYGVPLGTDFVNDWASWKMGRERRLNAKAQKIAADIREIFGLTQLEINPSEDRKTLHIVLDGKAYMLAELGAGLAQFIVTFVNVAMREPAILLIDEPESNLHPALQMRFLTGLASYVQHGVVFATHSIGLARSTAERIYSIKKNGNTSTVHPFERTPNYAEFLGEMSFSTFTELGFKHLLLVEGVTEVTTFQQFLRQLGLDHLVVVVPLGGSALISAGRDQELSELKRITSNISVIIDSERSEAGATLAGDRTAFSATCTKLSIPILVTERRATENYFTQRALQRVNDSYKQLGEFQSLKSLANHWLKSENWRIAKEMTKEELLDTDIGKFLQGIAS